MERNINTADVVAGAVVAGAVVAGAVVVGAVVAGAVVIVIALGGGVVCPGLVGRALRQARTLEL